MCPFTCNRLNFKMLCDLLHPISINCHSLQTKICHEANHITDVTYTPLFFKTTNNHLNLKTGLNDEDSYMV
jgi:hypothetical protein